MLLAIGLDQHAIVSLDDCLRAGIARATIQKWARAQELFRLHQGIYSLVPPKLLTRKGHYLAAVLACGPSAALSYRAAAALGALRNGGRRPIEVTVIGSGTRVHAGVQVHRSRTLDAARDVVRIDNIPVTSVARTLLDLCEVLPPRAVERALHQADVLQVLDLAAINDQLARNRGRHRAHVLAELIERHHGADTLTANESEERVLAIIRTAELPRPEVNALIALPEGEPIYGDFVWPAQRLIVETDGRASHATGQAFEGDRVRDQRALLAGWRVVRFTWRQVVQDPARVAATIAALLDGSPAGRATES